MVDRRATALDAFAAPMAAASGDGVRLSALPRLGQVTLRAAGEATALAMAAIGIDLPAEPNRWSGNDDRLAVWLGPDEWLVLVPDGEAGAVVARIQLALGGRHVAAVDTSAARIGIVIAGAMARTAIARDCPIDLHPRAFARGSTAQTLVARVPALLLQRDDEPTYWLLARPSLAPHLAGWLVDAARAVQLPPVPGVSP